MTFELIDDQRRIERCGACNLGATTTNPIVNLWEGPTEKPRTKLLATVHRLCFVHGCLNAPYRIQK